MNVAKGMTSRWVFSQNFHGDRAIVSRHGKGVQTQLSDLCNFASLLGLESVKALRQVALWEEMAVLGLVPIAFFLFAITWIIPVVTEKSYPVWRRKKNFLNFHHPQTELFHILISDICKAFLAYHDCGEGACLIILYLNLSELKLRSLVCWKSVLNLNSRLAVISLFFHFYFYLNGINLIVFVGDVEFFLVLHKLNTLSIFELPHSLWNDFVGIVFRWIAGGNLWFWLEQVQVIEEALHPRVFMGAGRGYRIYSVVH